MIIKCEQCNSEFNIDETLLKPGGSKVRCAVCKHVFVAHPVEKAPVEELSLDDSLEQELEDTMALDSIAEHVKKEPETVKESAEAGFDKAFEDALEEPAGADGMPDLGEGMDVEGVMDQASMIEEEVTRKTTREIPRGPGKVEKAPAVPRPVKKPGRSPFLTVLLLIILLLLGGSAAVYFLAPDLIPDRFSFLRPATKEEITDVGIQRLSFKAVTGSFVESNKAGQLFVVKGMVTNNYSEPRSFILIKGSILDEEGQVLKRKLAYAGNIFSEEQLGNMTLEEIRKGLKNRFGKGRMNMNIGSGGSIPFTIIFDELPESMSEFTVEAVRSSAAE